MIFYHFLKVFELLERGPVVEVPSDNPLEEDQARTRFRDLLMGIEYRNLFEISYRLFDSHC